MVGHTATGTWRRTTESAGRRPRSTGAPTCWRGNRAAAARNGALAVVAIAAVILWPRPTPAAAGVDESPPAILQWFESSYGVIEERLPDVFAAGCGFMWLPPPF